MARIKDRLFAGFGAALFLGSACALTVFVIIQSNSSPATTSSSSTSATPSPATNKLQGTKLAGFTPIASVDSLQSTDTKVGTGAEVKAGDTVSVDYTGALAATGVIFQSSLDTGQPVSLSLGQVIQGWQTGIPGMKVGGTRRLVIPAAQAYGAQAQTGIPANSNLVFDITLHSIGK